MTPSGAAPMPYSKSTFPSTAFNPPDTSPSPISIGSTFSSFIFAINSICLSLSMIMIFNSEIFLSKALAANDTFSSIEFKRLT